MSKRRTHQKNPAGRPLSGLLATVLSAIATRLVYRNALSSRGALRRSLILPVVVVLASALRWWSRSYLGQRLGFGWSRRTYSAGHAHRYTAAEVGDEWQQFKHGNVVISPLLTKSQRPRSPKRSDRDPLDT